MAEGERFANRPAQIGAIVFGIIFALLGAPQFSDGGAPAVGIGMAAIGLAFAIRGMRTSEVYVDETEVITRSMLLKRRIALSELARAEVILSRTGAGSGRRETLELHFRNGESRRFSELNAPVPANGASTNVVRSAAMAINTRIRTSSRDTP